MMTPATMLEGIQTYCLTNPGMKVRVTNTQVALARQTPVSFRAWAEAQGLTIRTRPDGGWLLWVGDANRRQGVKLEIVDDE